MTAYDFETPNADDPRALCSWLQWQLTLRTADQVQDAIALSSQRWIRKGASSASTEHLGQLTALLFWYTGDLVAHIVDHRDKAALIAADSLLNALRQARQWIEPAVVPDYTEMMEDQDIMADPTMAELEEVA